MFCLALGKKKKKKKQFIPYEMSVKLKELGFNEKCFDVYSDVKSVGMFRNSPRDRTPKILWQQAFYFFIEKHDLYCAITSSTMMIDWTYYIFKSANSKPLENPILEGWTYEEARLACLEKLIEIVENKKW